MASDTRKSNLLSCLAGLKTSGTHQRAVRNQCSTLEEHTHTLAYSWEPGMGSRLDRGWGSGQFPVTTTVCTPTHTGCLHQPLALQHCCPLGQRYLCWGRTAHMEEAEPAHTSPASGQDEGSCHQGTMLPRGGSGLGTAWKLPDWKL